MRIILISGRGVGRAIEFRASRIVAALTVSVVLLGLLSRIDLSDGIRDAIALITPAVDSAVVANWQKSLEVERVEFKDLRERLRADNEAAGKLLAQMQARLLRVEALGQRVVAAAFEKEEFDFSSEPAVGGPIAEQVEETASTDIRHHIALLSDRLRAREAELEILENLLSNRDQLADLAVGGSPVRRGWISSPFGWRVDPINGKRAMHAGVDFSGRLKSDVMAVAGGVVTFAGEKEDYGQLVEVSHGNGLLTRYGHHAELLVRVGDIVRKGEVIGLMGSTGRATGSHLHFEVEKDGVAVDPTHYLKRSG